MAIGGKILFLAVIGTFTLTALPVDAHRSGCHRWHSCPSDTGSYICGDLGYPCQYGTHSESGVSNPGTTYTSPYILGNVPHEVEVAFEKVVGRKPNDRESKIFKDYVRSQILITRASLEDRIRFEWGAYLAAQKTTPDKINALFRLVYDRNPTPSENRYWLTRIKDKPTYGDMFGAMTFHKVNGINH